MLHLRRQLGESIMIGDDCLLTVVNLLHARRAAAILISRPSSAHPGELDARTVELVVDAPHRITDAVAVTLANVSADQAVLAIDAPKTVSVHRLEVYDAIRREGDDDEGTGGAPVPRSPWPPASPPSLSVRLNPPTSSDDAGN